MKLCEPASEMKMSYKKAWTLINNLNENTKVPVVVPQKGGDNGGGSIVTDAGKALINYHKELRARFRKFLEEETKRLKE